MISGRLQQYIEKDGLRGVQSNFQSLQAAIQGQEYDRDFSTLAQQGISWSARSTYDYLIVRDLQLAADLLKQVHAQTQGRDGLICRLTHCFSLKLRSPVLKPSGSQSVGVIYC